MINHIFEKRKNNYSVISLSGKSGISNDSLNFGGFLSFLATLGGEFSSNNALLDQSDVISFFQSKEFSNFVSSLGTQSSRAVDVGETGDFLFTFLGDSYG